MQLICWSWTRPLARVLCTACSSWRLTAAASEWKSHTSHTPGDGLLTSSSVSPKPAKGVVAAATRTPDSMSQGVEWMNMYCVIFFSSVSVFESTTLKVLKLFRSKALGEKGVRPTPVGFVYSVNYVSKARWFLKKPTWVDFHKRLLHSDQSVL